MAASLTRLIRTLPVPLFGSLNTAAAFTIAKSKALPRMAGWTVPLAIGGLWFVWPAVDDGWKIEMGFKSDPEAAAAAAAAAAQESAAKEKESKITLSEEAMTKVENAYKASSEHVDTDDDKLLSVVSPVAMMTELHQTKVDKHGIMRMEEMNVIRIQKETQATLKPAGMHVMLMGLKRALKNGEEVPLQIR